MALTPAIFLDKDGTILADVPYNVAPERMRFADGALEGLGLLAPLQIPLIVVSNQPGVALGRFEPHALAAVRMRLHEMFAAAGASLAGFYWCPHHPRGSVAPYSGVCACRKPQPGLLLRAAREYRIDLARSWLIGDILDDVEAGNRAGCRTILLDVGNETEWVRGPWRTPTARVPTLAHAARMVVQRLQRPAAEVA
ncbi:HAD family hydrolase [Bordetella genomosp. 7]|uniref:D-glycero-alpha-D-manno-heptose-1,7-bisphosphate 7-phosphatase n=1 Tax=Bordetella TaxID=517 RepID=UPI0004AE1FC7|nr:MULTISPECIES: HAD family hydrolase [Bordetella]OZI27014.1 HAD family hydrolase [Bordetella genomosp. 7]